MMTSIHLYYQVCFWAIEIEDILTKWYLTAETKLHLLAPQTIPELPLCLSHFLTKAPCMGSEGRSVIRKVSMFFHVLFETPS